MPGIVTTDLAVAVAEAGGFPGEIVAELFGGVDRLLARS
jgi:hypothetical protein